MGMTERALSLEQTKSRSAGFRGFQHVSRTPFLCPCHRLVPRVGSILRHTLLLVITGPKPH